MSGITLSSATRSNLLSLKSTAEMMANTQNRLATGKRVSSGLDNPVNYFTASALTSRSSDLNSLIDGISNGIQTIQAATKGIDSINNLVKLGQSMVDRAARAPVAVQTPAAVASMGSNYSSADIVGAQNATAPGPTESTADFSVLHGDYFDTTVSYALLNTSPGKTITISQSGLESKTYTSQPTGPIVPGSGNFANEADLKSLIRTDFPNATIPTSSFVISSHASDAPITVTGSATNGAPMGPNLTPATPASTFQYTVNGTYTANFKYRSPADPANGYFNSPSSLAQAINAKK